MAYLRDEAIVLRKEPFREQDRRYTFYGREHGLLQAVARGASLRTSKQAGCLEPFRLCQVMIAKGRAYDVLAVATAMPCSWNGAAPTLSWYAISGGLSDILVRLIRPGIADERIFVIIQHACESLSRLTQEVTVERARFALATVSLQVLDALGYAPQFPAGETAENALLGFMRRARLWDALCVTAPVETLIRVSSFVESAMHMAPFEKEPHGVKTVHALLTVSRF